MTAISKGTTVVRKVDRKKACPTLGTVERILAPGTYSHRYPRAVVRWHGNVRYLSGRTNQRSTVKLDALEAVGGDDLPRDTEGLPYPFGFWK